MPLDHPLKTRLLSFLLSLPQMRQRAWRDAWLDAIRDVYAIDQIDRDDVAPLDLRAIVDHIDGLWLVDGRALLVVLFERLPDVVTLAGTSHDVEHKALLVELRQALPPLPIVEPKATPDALPASLEIVIGADERVNSSFLHEGLRAGQAVARLYAKSQAGGINRGTGWLIAPSLLVTARHVIEGPHPQSLAVVRWNAAHAALHFGLEQDSYTEYAAEELVWDDRGLDVAVLRMSDFATDPDGPRLAVWGHLSVVAIPPALEQGAHLNIIQHAENGPRQYALRANYYIGESGAQGRFHYLSDTRGGASGSPVLNDDWQVVGLHRAAVRYDTVYHGQTIRVKALGIAFTPPDSPDEQPGQAWMNEGVWLYRILDSLPPALRAEIAAAQPAMTAPQTYE